MQNKNFKEYLYQKNNSTYVIEEDLIGWYLIIYDSHNVNSSSQDYLFDTMEEAFDEAKNRFGILSHFWQEVDHKDEDFEGK